MCIGCESGYQLNDTPSMKCYKATTNMILSGSLLLSGMGRWVLERYN